MAQPIVKAEIHRLVDSLPDGATWEDLKYLVYFRARLDAGRESAERGSTRTTDDIRQKYGLDAQS